MPGEIAMNWGFGSLQWGVAACAWCAIVVAGTLGCEKTPDEKLRRAKVLLTKESKPDTAEEKLRAVLDEDSDHIEARRLMAKVYRLRGQFDRAEEKLDALWSEHDFDDEDQELSGRLRNARELIRAEYVDLYDQWASEIEPAKRPDRYTDVLERGLTYSQNDTNLELSMELAKFYWSRGQKLVEEGKKEKAAETFSRIRNLRTRRGWEKREEALSRTRELRLEFFKKKGRKRFEKEAQPLIAELEGLELDEEAGTIRIDLAQSVDRKLDPQNEADREKAKKMAFVALIDKLRKLALTIAGLSLETDLRKIGTDRAKEILLGHLEFDEEDRTFRRGRYEISAVLSVDEAIQMAYDVKSAYEEAESEKSSDGGGMDEGTPDDAGGGDASEGHDGRAEP